jgi:hypothetical protein
MTITPQRHNQHCKECKERFVLLLEYIAGERILRNQSFGWSASPVDQSDLGDDASAFLEKIYERLLMAAREELGTGLTTLVRASRMSPVDYFLPRLRAIIEFDERQHFTPARRLTLEMYKDAPIGFAVNFDAERWIELCEHHQARDRLPPHRDWQRAWLDTLRDTRSAFIGNLEPIRRVYAGDTVWCRADLNSPEGQQRVGSVVRLRTTRR